MWENKKKGTCENSLQHQTQSIVIAVHTSSFDGKAETNKAMKTFYHFSILSSGKYSHHFFQWQIIANNT